MPTSPPRSPELDALAREALSIGDMRSAAIFRRRDGDAPALLDLVGAAGIDGPALDALVAAVQNPSHPVARAVADAGPTFDVLPMNPGGPRLRSHLPIRTALDAKAGPARPADGRAMGVLALAHEAATTEADRARLDALAGSIAAALAKAADARP